VNGLLRLRGAALAVHGRFLLHGQAYRSDASVTARNRVLVLGEYQAQRQRGNGGEDARKLEGAS
jgi:hypothetical protein